MCRVACVGHWQSARPMNTVFPKQNEPMIELEYIDERGESHFKDEHVEPGLAGVDSMLTVIKNSLVTRLNATS